MLSQRRKVLIGNFLTSEVEVVDGLLFVKNEFLTPLMAGSRLALRLELADRTAFSDLVVEMLNFHLNLLERCRASLAAWTETSSVGALFSSFKIPAHFEKVLVEMPPLLDRLQKARQDSKVMNAFCRKFEDQALQQNGKWSSLRWIVLDAPVSLIHGYEGLLEQCNSQTRQDDPNHQSILAAFLQFTELSQRVVELGHKHELRKVMEKHLKTITGWTEEMMTNSRFLASEGPATSIDPADQKKKPVHLFLFSDQLMETTRLQRRVGTSAMQAKHHFIRSFSLIHARAETLGDTLPSGHTQIPGGVLSPSVAELFGGGASSGTTSATSSSSSSGGSGGSVADSEYRIVITLPPTGEGLDEEKIYYGFPDAEAAKLWATNISRVTATWDRERVFAVPLAVLMKSDREYGNDIPSIVSKTIGHIIAHGLDTVGIFRMSGAKRDVDRLRKEFDTNPRATLLPTEDIHAVAVVLKQWLRELPDAVIPQDFHDKCLTFIRTLPREAQNAAIRQALAALPPTSQYLLQHVVSFIALIASHQEQNKMSLSNLAIVFVPTLGLQPLGLEDQDHAFRLFERLVVDYDEIFGDIETARRADKERWMKIAFPAPNYRSS